VYNARLLGVDLSAVDRIVLSHGHSDHTSGLREVLQQTADVEVAGHPDIWGTTYVRRDDGRVTSVGRRSSDSSL
jgi:7,8-dihydropterin-6-yl-methyl-4-(beta-D-ribofuranosyl)aminobenzene 5'-phosphate synthase